MGLIYVVVEGWSFQVLRHLAIRDRPLTKRSYLIYVEGPWPRNTKSMSDSCVDDKTRMSKISQLQRVDEDKNVPVTYVSCLVANTRCR